MTLAGCGGAAVAVRPPPTGGSDARACRALHRLLPGELDGRGRRDTTPGSRLTAAWGDPAVVMRCGVRRPRSLTASSEVIEVNRVDWFLSPGSSYVFTTVGRTANVEVRVPASTPRTQATAPLVDLAAAVRRGLPRV